MDTQVRIRAPAWQAALAGAVGAGVALAVGEVLGALVPGVPSLVVAVGSWVIELAPSGAKRVAVELFGTADKLALNLGIAVISVAIAAALGRAEQRRRGAATGGFVAFGIVGIVASLTQPGASLPRIVLGTALAVVAGLASLRWLLRLSRWDAEAEPDVPGADMAVEDGGRRRFLLAAGSLAAGAVISAAVGRALLQNTTAVGPGQVTVPPPVEPVTAPPPAASFDVPGLTPVVVPNPDFYRIDTALVVPRLDADSWSLRIHGLVDREVTLTYRDVLEMDLVERYVTIACVSNEVGGGLVGNAAWTGVPLAEVLDRAGVRVEAGQLVGRAHDGWTAGFPVRAAMDGRDALLAVGMNGEPLPPAHGFPARLIVPGLYGYVSATKWITEIELTTWDQFDAYWIRRGWAKEGPVKTQSRIDTPRGGTQPAGTIPIAGVAWAPNIGITNVEVRIDDGDWREARLSEQLDEDAWRQFLYEWDARPGDHIIRVRATDASGYTQTDERTDNFPAGATGHHTVRVTVA